ncbi:MAG: hypothetical protein R2778_01770 [Saprospiraceae bacterium]
MTHFLIFPTFNYPFHEGIENAVALHQQTRRTGTHALIEREHHSAFQTLVKEIIIGVHDAFEENIR